MHNKSEQIFSSPISFVELPGLGLASISASIKNSDGCPNIFNFLSTLSKHLPDWLSVNFADLDGKLTAGVRVLVLKTSQFDNSFLKLKGEFFSSAIVRLRVPWNMRI